MKKVVLKILDDGRIEIISKDKDVAVIIQLPDGAQVELEKEKPGEDKRGLWQ